MRGPQIDPTTAESMLDDSDFADEHTKPTYADEPSTEGPDESVPTGRAGDGGMDPAGSEHGEPSEHSEHSQHSAPREHSRGTEDRVEENP